MEFLGGLAVRLMGGFCCWVKTKEFQLPADADMGLPFAFLRVDAYALEARRVALLCAAVHVVLAARRVAQVRPTVVQGVPVDVVGVHALRSARDQPVHVRHTPPTVWQLFLFAGIELPGEVESEPVGALNQRNICGINHGGLACGCLRP